jgi:hypothetical protein
VSFHFLRNVDRLLFAVVFVHHPDAQVPHAATPVATDIIDDPQRLIQWATGAEHDTLYYRISRCQNGLCLCVGFDV